MRCRAEVAGVQRLRCLFKRGHRVAVECTADADAAHSRRRELFERNDAASRPDEHVHRLRGDSAHDRVDGIHVGQTRRVEHVGAGLCERDEAPDRVVDILATVQEIIGSPREHDVAARGSRGGAHTSDGMVKLVDRAFRVRGRVLDSDARQPGVDGRSHGVGAVLWVRTETVFQVTIDG